MARLPRCLVILGVFTATLGLFDSFLAQANDVQLVLLEIPFGDDADVPEWNGQVAERLKDEFESSKLFPVVPLIGYHSYDPSDGGRGFLVVIATMQTVDAVLGKIEATKLRAAGRLVNVTTHKHRILPYRSAIACLANLDPSDVSSPDLIRFENSDAFFTTSRPTLNGVEYDVVKPELNVAITLVTNPMQVEEMYEKAFDSFVTYDSMDDYYEYWDDLDDKLWDLSDSVRYSEYEPSMCFEPVRVQGAFAAGTFDSAAYDVVHISAYSDNAQMLKFFNADDSELSYEFPRVVLRSDVRLQMAVDSKSDPQRYVGIAREGRCIPITNRLNTPAANNLAWQLALQQPEASNNHR